MKQVEIWKQIKDYPNYEVSNLGNVRSRQRKVTQLGHKNVYTRIMQGKMLKPRLQNSGYLIVWLSQDGKTKPFTIHRLVAAAFVEGSGNDVNHKDGNKLNNWAENLEWVTRSENITHAYRVLKRVKHQQKAVICIETGEHFASMREASKQKGVNAISIGHCLAGRNKTAGGFTWKRE